MKCKYTVRNNEMVIQAKKDRQIPSKIIREVNTFLASKYLLYEYTITKGKAEHDKKHMITVRRPLFFSSMYLTFSPLNQRYINERKYIPTSLRAQYERDILGWAKGMSYGEYLDRYLMDWRGSMQYIATKNLNFIFEDIKWALEAERPRKRADVEKLIKRYSTVSISLFDDSMFISTEESHVMNGLIRITSKCCQ